MVPVAHIENHDLDLYVREQLGSKHSSSIQAHVQSCAACEEKLVAGLLARLAELNQKQPSDSSRELRIERRFQSGDHGSLQTICPLSFERSNVQIADISKGGFGLLTNTFLPTGTIVQIHIGTSTAWGEVRFCRTDGNSEFHAGIQLRSVGELKGLVGLSQSVSLRRAQV
jgi:hypothetical protein